MAANTFRTKFLGFNVFGWTIDSIAALKEALGSFKLDKYVNLDQILQLLKI